MFLFFFGVSSLIKMGYNFRHGLCTQTNGYIFEMIEGLGLIVKCFTPLNRQNT